MTPQPDGASIYSMEKNGDLHMQLHGIFDINTAIQLSAFMSESYNGQGNIFINMENVTNVTSQSQKMFESMLGVFELPKQNVFLIRENGVAFGYNERAFSEQKNEEKDIDGCGCGGKCVVKCNNCTCN